MSEPTPIDRLADFVPSLTRSRVVSCDGDTAVVEELGAARFLFFHRAIRLLVRVRERAAGRIDVGLVEGNMRVYRVSWELQPVDGGGERRIRSVSSWHGLSHFAKTI